MTHIVLPGMVNRRRGAIVNLSSGAGRRPVPLISAYSACKVYVCKVYKVAVDMPNYGVLISTDIFIFFSPTWPTYYYLVNRRRGAIVNLSSGAGRRPVPLISAYSACKVYVCKVYKVAVDMPNYGVLISTDIFIFFSPTWPTYYYLVNRRRGAIVNLSSGAGRRPVPLISAYSACKVCKGLLKRTAVAGSGMAEPVNWLVMPVVWLLLLQLTVLSRSAIAILVSFKIVQSICFFLIFHWYRYLSLDWVRLLPWSLKVLLSVTKIHQIERKAMHILVMYLYIIVCYVCFLTKLRKRFTLFKIFISFMKK